MPWILGAAILGSGALASGSAKKGAEAAERTGAEQTALQREMFEKQIELQQPWYEAGVGSLEEMERLRTGDLSGYYESPEYTIGRGAEDKTRQALEQQFAARGKVYSSDYANALAGTEASLAQSGYQNYLARLASGAGIGQQTGTSMGGQYSQQAQGLTNILGNVGAARTSSYTQQGNIAQNMLGQGMQLYGMSQQPQNYLSGYASSPYSVYGGGAPSTSGVMGMTGSMGF